MVNRLGSRGFVGARPPPVYFSEGVRLRYSILPLADDLSEELALDGGGDARHISRH